MKLAIIGGSGYVGHHLIAKLITETPHELASLSLNAEKIDYKSDRVTPHNTDVFDTAQLHERLVDCDAVYYLVHMMAQKKYDFAEAESRAAESLIEACKNTSVKKIIFLGGLGNDKEQLSKHLASRHKTGDILRKSDAQVIEFRASMVVGKGSVSYDIIARLVEKLPVMGLPTWAKTLTQPIGLNDATDYLVAALSLSSDNDEVVEIGGPESMTYEKLMRSYATWKGTRTLYVHVPFVPVFIASHWLDMFTPKPHARVGRMMVESLANPMIVTNDRAKELFPQIKSKPIDQCFV